MMASYQFLTIWEVAAPIEPVWCRIIDYQKYPTWWPAVAAISPVKVGESQGVGNIWKMTWKTPLGYPLSFDAEITQLVWLEQIELHAIGEVEGVGKWKFTRTEQGTQVKYYWTVKTTQSWMNLLAVFVRPLLEWNHHTIMRQGGKRLAQSLKVPLLKSNSVNLSSG